MDGRCRQDQAAWEIQGMDVPARDSGKDPVAHVPVRISDFHYLRTWKKSQLPKEMACWLGKVTAMLWSPGGSSGQRKRWPRNLSKPLFRQGGEATSPKRVEGGGRGGALLHLARCEAHTYAQCLQQCLRFFDLELFERIPYCLHKIKHRLPKCGPDQQEDEVP